MKIANISYADLGISFMNPFLKPFLCISVYSCLQPLSTVFGAKGPEDLFKVLGKGRFCLNIFTTDRMYESKYLSVQTLSAGGKGGFSAAPVDSISEQRVPAKGHMDADLVSPACLQPAFHVCIIAETF